MVKYPVYQPLLAGNEKKYVLECLESSWISSKGSFVSRFENIFSEYIGVKHSIGVCNGTAALHVALLALVIGPGDEVIVPTLTFVATANAITYTGARPIFIDSDSQTWNIDTSKIESVISVNTKAILCVHLYGNPCNVQVLIRIKEKYIFLAK